MLKNLCIRIAVILPLAFFIFLHGNYVAAQEGKIVIKGKVIDAQSQKPLSDVSVSVKDKKRGTSTNGNGDFSISVLTTDILEFSSVSYKPHSEWAGKIPFPLIKLIPSSTELDDVVVVGYGKQKKANVTGAISTVSSKMIENRPVSNLTTALQGTASGMIVTRDNGEPGEENESIQIRGVTSANGNVNPLVIIDGVPSPVSTLSMINPNDVESVSILKDAAAAAIYGAQAAGGVILVTTKKGSGKPSFSYTNLTAFQHPMNVPKRLSLLEEALYSNLARKNAGISDEYGRYDFDIIKLGLQYYVNPSDTSQYVYYNTKDLLPQIMRSSSPMITHDFSVRGGTDKIYYLASFGYYNQKGIWKIGPDQLHRYNGRINMGAKISDKITLDSRVAFTNWHSDEPARTNGGTGASSLLNRLYRFRQRWPFLNPEGQYNASGVGSGVDTWAYLEAGGYQKYVNNNLDGVFTLKASDLFTKGLELRAIYGGQYYNSNSDIFNRSITTYYRNVEGLTLNDPNSYYRYKTNTMNSNFQFLADYDWHLGTKHNFHILGGYQWTESRTDGLYTSANNLTSNDLPSLNLGNNLTKTATEYIATYAYQSVFGRFNYNFDNKYLFEATVRSDESSRLAPGLRTKVFPAFSGGWNMHKEHWFQSVLPMFSEFKPRGSWGRLGSAEGSIIGNYDYLNLLNTGSGVVLGNPETRSTYFYNSSIPSASLTWETVETTDGGLDVGLLNNKLTFSFDYYWKFNKNMLIPQTLPGTLGTSAPVINGGELKSWGWELTMNYNNHTSFGLDYSLGLNFSDDQNKLIKYNNDNVINESIVGLLEGYPMRTIWGYKTNGYIQNQKELDNAPFLDSRIGIGDVKYVDLDHNGIISAGKGTKENHGDLVNLGTDQPRYTFGFNASASWKGFDLAVFIQGVLKRTYYPDMNVVQGMPYSWTMPLQVHMDFWTTDNRNAAFPRPYYGGTQNYHVSDKWVLNGAYVRLKNVQVGYSLPVKLLSKAGITKCRFFFSGQDLYTWDKLGIFHKLINPENHNSAGHDYPLFGVFSGGVNLTF